MSGLKPAIDISKRTYHRALASGPAAVAAAAVALIVLSLTTCNIFKTGLGPKVDVTPPELTITSPASGTYVHGTVVLTGTASDDVAVKTLTVTYPATGGGTAERPITLSGKAWTVQVPSGVAGGLAEGKDTLTVTASAASGKSATASVLAYVDNTPPTVLVTTPTTYGSPYPVYSSYVDVSGQAYDASPVSTVSVTVSYVDAGGPKSVTQTANGTNSWSTRFLLNASAGGPLGLADDHIVLSYSVTVTDVAGNASTYYYHSQDIYGLLTPGKLFPTMLELGQLDQGGASPSTPTGIAISALSAHRMDNAQASRGDLEFSFAFIPTIQYSNLDPANPPANVLAPGSVIVGNVIPPGNAGAVDPASLVFEIFTSSSYPAGPPEVTLTAASPLGSQLVLTNLGSSQGFKVTLQNTAGVNLAPGQYILDVSAAAQGSGTAHDHVDFGIDSSAPTLTETSVGNSLALYGQPFLLSGLAASLSGLSTLLVEQSADGGVSWATAYSKIYAGSPVSDNWSTPAASLPNPGGDGSYTYRLTLTTVSGLTALVYRSVIFDGTPPYVNVTSPAPGAWTSSASPTLTGTAGDGSGSGVSTVYYLVDAAANDHSAEVASWASSSGPGAPTGSWSLAGGIVSSWTSSPALSGEGNKRLWVVAVDLAGNRDSLALVPATSLVAGTKYTIDTLGTTNFVAVGAASNTVGLTFTATGAGAGSGIAWTGGGEAVPFGYDQNPPALSETHAAATTFTAATAGSFLHFDGNVSDSDALAGLSVQYSKNGVPQSTVPITPAGASWSWTPFASGIDVAGHTNDAVYAFTFTATDIAGKTTSLSRTMTVDTEAPTIAVTAPTSGGWVSTTALSVTGSAGDGAGSGVSQVYLKVDDLYVASSPTDHSAEDPTVPANGWTLATGLTNWSSLFTLSGEGRKTLWTMAMDAVGNVTTTAGAVSSRVDFGLDLNPPTLAFTDSVGTLVSAGFGLAGTTTDTNPAGASTLAVTVDGGASQAVPVAAGAWTFPVTVDTVTHANDGSHTYVFTATDVAGKTTTLSRTITVDTTPPTTTIAQPGNYAPAQSQYWLSGATASLGGSAADAGASASGVARVYFKVDAIANSHASDDAATITGTWTLAAGSSTWSATYSLSSEGQFSLWTAAFDNAGNLSSIVSRSFGVDQNPPTLTETNHPAISATKSAFTLAGATGDSNALATLTITESKDLAPSNAVIFTTVPASLAGATSATYISQSLPIAGASDGSYAYVLTATDVAGKTTTVNRIVNIDTTPPTVNLTAIPAWISSSAYTVSGTATDPNSGASGVSLIEYQLDGGAWTTAAWTDTSGGANTSGTWSATLSSMAEGNHSIIVRATDAATNATTLGAAAFGVDVNPPTVTETALGTTSQVTKNAAFTMTGTVSDSNPVSVAGTTLTVSVSVNGGAASAAAMVGNAWSFTQPKVDGTYSYVITATDASAKTVTLNRLVLVDSTPPTLTVIAPTPAPATWVSSTLLSIGGTSNDGAGSGVNKTYYLVDSASNDHSPDIAAWNLTTGASAPSSGTSATWAAATGLPANWSGSSTLAGEGAEVLWIVSADNAGNSTALGRVAAGSFNTGTVYTIAALGTTDFTAIGASSNTVGLAFTATGPGSGTGSAWAGTGIAVPFGLDLNPPALSETAIATTSTVVRNSSVAFSGSASDTNALAAAHYLTVSVDGGAAADVSFTVAPSWSFTYSVNPATHAQDGTHSFVFAATDVAGKTTTVTRSVQVDTTPATVSVTSPSAGIWTGASPFTVTGTASDGAGSGVSQVWTIVDASAISHAADTTTAITTGGAWKQATGTSNWTWSWTLTAEETKTLWVAVLDAAGNWSTTYTTVDFGYDATPPALTIAAMGGYRIAFTITGTVSDAASGVSSLRYKIDSGTLYTVTVSASWNAAIPAADFNALGEGIHTVTVQAIDTASNQTTQVSTFSKDTTPPTLTYSNISSGGGTVVQDSTPVLSGTLTDVSGAASAAYTLEVWNYSTQAWNTIASGASLGSPAGASSWSWSLDLSATGLKLPDGKYRIAIGASDVPGNAIAAPLSVPFLLSRSNPGALIAAPNLGTFQNAAFPLVGTASDPNGVTQVRAKIATGSVDFSSGTTSALPALPVAVTVGSPGQFRTPAIHGLNVGDQVYVWGTPMPVAPGGPLQTANVYYVQSVPSSTTFTISATSGGPALAITTSTASDLVVGIPNDTFATFFPSIPVTVSGSTMTAPNHGLSDGDIVYFAGTSLPAPASASTPYYVVNAAASTFQVSTTSGGSVFSLSTSGTGVSVYSPTHAVNWLIPAMAVGAFGDGPLTSYVQASAGSGKISQTSRDFTLDTAPPTIAISSPSSGTRSVGNLTLVGTTNDAGSIPSGVTGTIQYQIGKNYNLGNPASWTSANVSGGSYSWTITLGDMSSYANATFATECDTGGDPASGTNLWRLPFVFQALDKAGNVQQSISYYLILDPNGNVPVVTITQPSTGLTFGGQQTITGTATQPVAIYGVEIAVDPSGGSNFPPNPVSVSIAGATLTAASHPFTNGMMVFLSGSTAPQIGGTPVAPTTPYWVVNATAGDFQVSATSGGSPVTFSSGGSGVSASVWAPATLTTTGNNVIWYYAINTTTAYPQGGATSQTVTIQARAWNSPTVGGPKGTISGLLVSPLSMTFNSSFPQVQNVQVNGQSYYSQITAAGTYSLTATVSSSKGIAKLESVEGSPLSGSTTMYNTANSYGATAAGNGAYWSSTVTPPATQTNVTFASGNTYKVMITATGSDPSLWTSAGAPAATPGTVFVPNGVTINVSATSGSFIESDVSGNFNYAVSMTINSASLFSATGQYVFNIRATDMTSPVAEVTNQPITINEDNYHPTAAIVSSVSVVGSQFVVQGSATDTGSGSGPISGFSKVVVYFVRSGNVINLSTGAPGATSSITAMDMASGGAIGSVTYPGVGAWLKLSIDSLAENNSLPTGGGTDVNGDGFMESLTIAGSSYTWMGQIDSTNIADGPVEVHYVAFDSAGNATHYLQSATIRNYAPSLSSVVLGTDLNGGGTISTTSSFSSGFTATNFTVRNRLMSFQIDSNYGGQNGALGYSLTYAGTEYWANAPASGETVSGVTTNSATLTLDFTKLSPAIPDSAVNGASFTLTVTAAPAAGGTQTYTQVINVTVQNTDVTPPTIAAAPFGQRYNVPTDAANGGVYTDVGKSLGAVLAYTDNVATSGPTLLGHVEYAANSIFADSQPNLSGQVIFRGKAYDNQRISRITATIAGYNGGSGAGAEFEIARWSGSAISPESGTGWAFAADAGSEGVSLPDGHVMNWSLTWDSSAIATVAAKNVAVTFKVYDFMTTGTGATRTASTITSSLFAGMAIPSGTPIYLFGGTTPTWTTTNGAQAGNTLTLTNVAIPTNNTSFIVSNAPASSAMTVDVVPYVTSVSNPAGQGLTSDVIRSSTGKYSIEVNGANRFNVTGFNLGAAGYLPAAWISTAPISTPSGQNPAATFVSSTSIQVAKTMAALRSGWLTIFVNGVPSANNLNGNASSVAGTYYNTEVNPANPVSAQWTDDRYIWLWAMTTLNGAAFNNQTYYYPDMIMNGAQPIFTYDNDNNGFNYRTTSDIATTQKAGMWYERQGAIAVNSSGTYYIESAEDAFSGGTIGNLQINRDVGQNAAIGAGSNADNVYELINEDYISRQLNRFRYPKLIAEGPNGATQIYSVVYDAHPSQNLLYFFSFQNTGSNLDNLTEVAANGGIAANGYMALPGTQNATSQYFAMAKIGAGTAAPIAVAYYDNTAAQLKLIYSSNHTTAGNVANTGATWTTMVVDSNLYAGTNVSMTTDGTDLYLAYYDSANADLKFAKVTWATKAVQIFTIDSYLSVGTWTGIQVFNGVPYITYYSDSFNGTSKPVRMAFPTNGTGGVSPANTTTSGANPVSEAYTGTWESVTIPASSAPKGGMEQFNHVQLGTYTNNTLTLPVVGYLANYLEYAKLQPNN